MERHFNRQMLVLAREFCGLTQIELAAQASMSQAEISKLETGNKLPSDEQIRRLAGTLSISEDLLFQWDVVQGFGSGCVYHRKRKSAPEAHLRRLLAMMNVRRIQVARLLQSASVVASNSFQRLDIDEYKSPQQVAQIVRHLWSLPPGPVHNLVRTIESAGGIIVPAEFGGAKVDAISQWPAGMPPVFLVNMSAPADRIRFTLAHELGHIFMHRVLTENMEKEADQFAAEFLMPESEIKNDLKYLTLARLATLKPHWRVSMGALLYRAAEIGSITERSKQYLWLQMGKKGYKTSEPVQIPGEQPTLVDELFRTHIQHLGFTPQEFAALLFARPDDDFICRHTGSQGLYRGFSVVR